MLEYDKKLSQFLWLPKRFTEKTYYTVFKNENSAEDSTIELMNTQR